MKIESAQAESILAEMTALIDVLGSALERCHSLSADADPAMAPHYLAQIKRTAAAALAERQRAETDTAGIAWPLSPPESRAPDQRGP